MNAELIYCFEMSKIGREAGEMRGETRMNLTQAEINALLSGGGAAALPDMPECTLTAEEIDTLGEVGNMCMGAMATTMYTLLDRRVEITTPRVSVLTSGEILSMYQVPIVVVEVEYTEGISGKNLLLLKKYDAALITDILMGGDGSVAEPVELDELHMSAMNEIMNQMIGASATALSQLISTPINISTPESRLVSGLPEALPADGGQEPMVIKISFQMVIEGLLESELVQILPWELGREISARMVAAHTPAPPPQPAVPPMPPATPAVPRVQAPAPAGERPAQAPGGQTGHPAAPAPGGLVNIRPMQFESFDEDSSAENGAGNGIGVVRGISLVVSAELGTARRSLNEVLAFEPGTVLMLNKSAGDPVEVMVNGKKIARGEVVVIDDNYGIRITSIFEKEK